MWLVHRSFWGCCLSVCLDCMICSFSVMLILGLVAVWWFGEELYRHVEIYQHVLRGNPMIIVWKFLVDSWRLARRSSGLVGWCWGWLMQSECVSDVGGGVPWFSLDFAGGHHWSHCLAILCRDCWGMGFGGIAGHWVLWVSWCVNRLLSGLWLLGLSSIVIVGPIFLFEGECKGGCYAWFCWWWCSWYIMALMIVYEGQGLYMA